MAIIPRCKTYYSRFIFLGYENLNFFRSSKKSVIFGTVSSKKSDKSDFDGPRMNKWMRHSTKLKMGDTTDDIHVCIMCLRAIMNNKFGFNMVIAHEQAINCIALSLVSHEHNLGALCSFDIHFKTSERSELRKWN